MYSCISIIDNSQNVPRGTTRSAIIDKVQIQEKVPNDYR